MKLLRPSKGTITSGYGPRTPGKVGSSNHKGIDFSWDHGWTVTAAASGTVVFIGSSGGFGNLIRVKHGLGYETWYAHLSVLGVHVGQVVSAGHPIGVIGNTGTSGGAHLHFELRLFGVPINPTPKFTTPTSLLSRILNKPGDTEMRIIYNKDASPTEDATRRAIVGELSFQVITGPQSTRERKFWGAPVNVTVGEWNAARDLVEARRKAAGL